MDICVLFVSLSMALNSIECSDCSVVNMPASPLGWSCDFVLYVLVCICACESEQQVAPLPNQPCCVHSAHRALWAVNNMVPQPRAPDRARRGVKTPVRKRKCLP